MAGRTIPQGTTGIVISISAGLPLTYDAAGYADTDIAFTAIGQIEDHGSHGGTKQIIEFTPVDTGVVQKIAGSKNYGTKTMMLGSVPTDAGQVILAAAFESDNPYSVKVAYPDGEIHYLEALIAKHEYQDGPANNVSKVAIDLAVTRKPIVVAAP